MIPKLLTRWYAVAYWIEGQATVVSREELFHEGQEGGPLESAELSFYYRDLSRSMQSGHLHVDNESPLYRLNRGDTFSIRFNPRRPSQYWCREAATFYSELPFNFGLLAFAVLLILLILSLVRNSG
jgi:hypothetical protein